MVNRVGDFGFALGILAIFLIRFDTVSFDAVFSAVPGMADAELTFLGHSFDCRRWRSPASFSSSGPWGNRRSSCCTPGCRTRWKGRRRSRALIHAATMVTAGVFMVARLSPIFEYAPIALSVVTFFGATTAIFAATIAITQNDIKRVIAYSTCSQLGYMFFACRCFGLWRRHLPLDHARVLSRRCSSSARAR